MLIIKADIVIICWTFQGHEKPFFLIEYLILFEFIFSFIIYILVKLRLDISNCWEFRSIFLLKKFKFELNKLFILGLVVLFLIFVNLLP